MTLNFHHDSISGDHTRHTARRTPGHQDAWQVSWLPGQLLDRTSAITAMALAEAAGGSAAPQAGDRLWPHIEGWAAELGLTGRDALARISQPSAGISAENDPAAPAERE